MSAKSICVSALLAGLMTSAALPAWAFNNEEKSYALSDVIVSATRSQRGQDVSSLGGSITVLDPEALEQRQARLLSDALRDIPGLSVSRAGAAGNFTQVRVRGSEANHVLVLVDGIEASDPFMGEFDFATLLADDLARVEVLRGQQSALYGSDAIAGVISYSTPSGFETPGGRLRIEGGSFGTYGAAARYAGFSENSEYVLSGAMQKSDGYVTATHGSRRIGSKIGSLSVRGSRDLSAHTKLEANLRWTSTEADTNGSDYITGYVVDTPGSYGILESGYGLVKWSYAGEGTWSHIVGVQGVLSSRSSYSASGRTGGGDGSRVKLTYVSERDWMTGAIEHRALIALDHERETMRNTASDTPWGADTKRYEIENTGAVVQYDLSSGPAWGGGLAIRYDRNDYFSDAVTYRLHAYKMAGNNLRLRGAAGTGIKNPGQVELFGYNAGAYPFVGNADLKPERSSGWEIGLDWGLVSGRGKASMTYFDAKLNDEIFSNYDVDPALCSLLGQALPSSCTTTGNRTTRSTQRGVELAADFRLTDRLNLSAAYTRLRARENGVREIRRPPHIASINLTGTSISGRGQVNLTARYNGDATDTDFSTYPARSVVLDEFWLLNVGASWKVTDKVQVFGRVENLGDVSYQEVLNYRSAGRAAYAGLRIQF